MMKDACISRAQEYVKELFVNEFSGHDYWHTMRVFHTASALAKEEKADLFLVQLAALLHDVDDVKLSPATCENKDHAVGFMRESQIDEERIRAVCQIIDEISYKGTDSCVPQTIEGKCVQDADRLDAIGAIGIGRAFAFGGNHQRKMYDPQEPPLTEMNEAQYRAAKSTTINHFYEKLFLLKDMMNTKSARAAAEKRDQLMRQFVEAFLAEWDGSLK